MVNLMDENNKTNDIYTNLDVKNIINNATIIGSSDSYFDD